MRRLAAWRSKRRSRIIDSTILLVLAVWGIRHALSAHEVGSIGTYIYTHWFFLFSYTMLAFTLLMSRLEKPRRDREGVMADARVTVVVPAYNEDCDALSACLDSLVAQSRKPNEIFVIDDGSNKVDYKVVKKEFEDKACIFGIKTNWVRKENGGKRHAQAIAFSQTPDTDIYVTVDSDSILDSRAIEELLQPFSDPQIQSVAGVVVAKNNRTNMLARITDLLFVTGQLIDRSMMSALGNVLVNSGGLAAYRGEIVRTNLDAYLQEEFFGHHIEFSDDSMLILFSLEKGKTVQQPTAFVFTMMPDNFSHHFRQQLRWMKGSFIRSWWRLKYLPINSYGFFRQAMGWAQFVMTTILFVLMLLFSWSSVATLAPYLLFAPVVVGYIQSLRYLTLKRSDEKLSSQLLTYVLAPLAVMWSTVVLRPIRLYAMIQCVKNEWGTRGSVEVTLVSSNRALPLAERLRMYREMVVHRENLYEYARREVLNKKMPVEIMQTVWHEAYKEMDEMRKWELWNGFEETLKNSNGKKPLISLAYK